MRSALSTSTKRDRVSKAFRNRCAERAESGGCDRRSRVTSLIPKRMDRVQRGGFSGRVVAEEDAYGAGEAYGDDHDDRGDHRFRAGEVAEDCGAGVADKNSGHAAEDAHHDALDEELREDVGAAG